MPHAKTLVTVAFVTFCLSAISAAAVDFRKEDVNLVASSGRSLTNWHGDSRFTSVRLEALSKSDFLDRHLANSQFLTAFTYSRVTQPHSWFGFRDGQDNLRAFAFLAAVRKNWRPQASVGAYAEMGTGPMWSNRRVPAATSQINFESQLGAGLVLRTLSTPFYVGYRFSHISNGGIVKRNPGLQVNALVVGFRAKRLRQ